MREMRRFIAPLQVLNHYDHVSRVKRLGAIQISEGSDGTKHEVIISRPFVRSERFLSLLKLRLLRSTVRMMSAAAASRNDG